MQATIESQDYGEYLVNARNFLGYTAEKMALLLDVKSTYVYRQLEKGRRLPDNWRTHTETLSTQLNQEAFQRREQGDFIEMSDSVEDKILHFHLKGWNVVKIGTRLNVDEKDVQSFLETRGKNPVKYFWAHEENGLC